MQFLVESFCNWTVISIQHLLHVENKAAHLKNESQCAVSLHESFMSILLIPLNKRSSAVFFPEFKNFYLKKSFVKVNTLLKFDRGCSDVGLSDSTGIEIEWGKLWQWQWITIRALCGKMFNAHFEYFNGYVKNAILLLLYLQYIVLYSVHSIQVLYM